MAFWETDKGKAAEVKLSGDIKTLETPETTPQKPHRRSPASHKMIAELEKKMEKRLKAMEKERITVPTYQQFMAYCKENKEISEFAAYFYKRSIHPRKPDRASLLKVFEVLKEMEKEVKI